jgi:ABC-type polar amino acid transport system ATPase subunit
MIETVDLAKKHGRIEVLRGISLRVQQGEVAVIVGPSGGGKSTFLRCINGLERFDAGRIVVSGLELGPGAHASGQAEEALKRVRCQVGMVFQQFHLFPHLTVLGNVIEAPMHVLGLDRDRAVERAKTLLERVGLLDKIDARPHQLSGGQQQRVAIARALAMEPKAILFDEPTSALDPRMTQEVLAVLHDLAKSGLTMVIVTHAMSFAQRVAHTVYVFEGGRVLESGPPSQIFGNPREEATRALLREPA